MKIIPRLFLLIIIAVACRTFPAHAAAPPRELWVYYPTNLLVDQNVDKLQTVWKRAAAAGYARVLLADSKFSVLDQLGDNEKHYRGNITRVKQIGDSLHLKIVPAVFSIGYSNDLLAHDPNLAEGLPVKDQPFTVHNGQAQPDDEPNVVLSLKPGWKDDCVRFDNAGVATVTDPPGNARIVWKLPVSPFRCYHVHVEISADHYTNRPEIKALGRDGQSLQEQNLPFKSTQDWQPCDVVFNSLDSNQVSLYMGTWGDANGTLRWRHWRIEPAGLVNILRRRGTPLVVKGAEGTILKEGTDFQSVKDPRLGTIPYAGEYESWHDPAALKTNLPDGTHLLISWFHPAIIYDSQVSICFADPAARTLLTNQAGLIKAAWGADGYMMSHDEIRVLGWDNSCNTRPPGELLADNARFCTSLLAGSDVYVWSDMFDPSHNAHDHYYLVRGNLTNSWAGLSSTVTIINWNDGHREESLKFFAARGHKQIIAGYYDAGVKQIDPWLSAADKVHGVTGVMYTTWRGDYTNLEAFAAETAEWRGAPR